MNIEKLKIAIVGSSGYAGGELFRILLHHPAQRSPPLLPKNPQVNRSLRFFPICAGLTELLCEPLNPEMIAQKADFVFLALPHVAAQEAAFRFFQLDKKLVDLSADYRIADAAIYEKWYEHGHQYPELLKNAVYGLPELHREKIRKCILVANPGCYPYERDSRTGPAVSTGWSTTRLSSSIQSQGVSVRAGALASVPFP